MMSIRQFADSIPASPQSVHSWLGAAYPKIQEHKVRKLAKAISMDARAVFALLDAARRGVSEAEALAEADRLAAESAPPAALPDQRLADVVSVVRALFADQSPLRQGVLANQHAGPMAAIEPNVRPVGMRKIPYFRVKIPAGAWVETEPRRAEEADGWIAVDESVPPGAFALEITGDCMEPDFPRGSIVIFQPILQGDPVGFSPGRAYYFESKSEGATFKRVYYEAAKKRYRLEAINPKYPPIYVPEQMQAAMSRAIRVIRELE